ncbi:MAG: STAS domain-containing protein [Terracidiphilus sp.]|jgi:anti-anti-sigma factor
MNIVQGSNAATVAVEADEPGGTAELVRGKEEALLERLKPMLQSQSVTLDMRAVQRIDAAGIAALISLYCIASEAGHQFTLSHPTPHVQEILQLVGLERMIERTLAAPSAGSAAQPGVELELSAA